MTCASANDCWAVGSYYNSAINATQTLIKRNTGSSWRVVSSPNTSGSRNNLLLGVSCAGPADCIAIGYATNSTTGISQTLIERNTGSGWEIVSSPNTGTDQNNTLNGVTCAGPSDCMAVGYAQFQVRGVNQTLIMRNTGSGWAIVSSPNGINPKNSTFLYGVSCAGAADCIAVGSNPNAISTAFQTLIEQDTGSGWAIVNSPNTSPVQSNYLFSATCASSTDCLAVGYYVNTGGNALYQNADRTEHRERMGHRQQP